MSFVKHGEPYHNVEDGMYNYNLLQQPVNCGYHVLVARNYRAQINMKPTEYDILLAGEQRIIEAIQQLEEEYNFHLDGMKAELERVREALTKCSMSIVHVSDSINGKLNSNQ